MTGSLELLSLQQQQKGIELFVAFETPCVCYAAGIELKPFDEPNSVTYGVYAFVLRTELIGRFSFGYNLFVE